MSALFARNVGPIDRSLRILLGIGLLSLVFVGPRTPWGWLGIIPLVTAVFSTCPLYSLLGVNTCSKTR